MERSKNAFVVMLLVLVSGLAWGVNDTRGRDLTAEPELNSVETKDGKHKYVPNQIIIKYKEKAANEISEQRSIGIGSQNFKVSSSLDALHKKHGLKEIKPIFKNHKKNLERNTGLLNKKAENLTKKEKQLVLRLKRAPKNAKVPALDKIYLLQVDLKQGESLEDVVAEFNQDPSVEYAELNFTVSTNIIPNESQNGLYSFQWALENTAQTYPASGSYNTPPGTADVDIDASAAWDITLGSANIIVAVVDTGVDYNHRDLQGNIWTNDAEMNGSDGVDDDMNGFVDDIYGYDFAGNGYIPDNDPIDDHGHGTHCAGTIGAKGNNGLDVVGVCWDVKIMAVKFLGASGSGSLLNGELSIEYAIENGADVISNSWGGGGYSQSLQDLIDYAYSQGIIFVAAAGNDNSSSVHYPAGYNHVISVAATDSNDDKASFSNYGEWVDIAAPGVDILSLRANGTSRGTTYDDYTTIMSGTSMACPHVAGACAAMFSANPLLTPDEMLDVLSSYGDPLLDPNICYSGSRLNLSSALSGAITPLGKIYLEHDYYSCSSEILIRMFDSDLSGFNTANVLVSTDSNDFETITLYEDSNITGFFTNSILSNDNPVDDEDGFLEISNGNIITVTYQDADDGTGNTSVATDTAVADCQAPTISNISIQPKGPEPEIFFDTNEPTYGLVRCGTVAGGPYEIIIAESSKTNNHSIKLANISQATTYYYVLEATDQAGNITIDNNSAQCYSFTSSSSGDIYVPSQASCIQDAIKWAWNDDTVWIADGTYTGDGNRDIDFMGKAITVASENGPKSCIIDCQGDPNDRHRGFYFHSGENTDSVISGLTITNGYSPLVGTKYAGDAIFCEFSSPNIKNCIVNQNGDSETQNLGGAIFCLEASPVIDDCVISNNYSALGGATLHAYGYNANPIISNCTIIKNSGIFGGVFVGGGSAKIENCIIADNNATQSGGGLHLLVTNSLLINCTIANNSAPIGNDIYFDISNANVSNCIVPESGISVLAGGNTFSYCNIQGSGGSGGNWDTSLGTDGGGNIDGYPLFVDSTNGNYHLTFDSPCRDSGTDVNEQTDIDGHPRKMSTNVDMGADEFLVAFNSTSQVGYETIQSAIDFAATDDEILLYPGTYTGAGNCDIDFGGMAVTLTGTDTDDWDVVESTIIDCQGSDSNRHRGFYFHNGEDADSIVSGLTVTNGYSPLVGSVYKGDAIFCDGANPTIKNCLITQNGGEDTQELGCTIYCSIASPKITNCVISGNRSGSGGAAIHIVGVGSDPIISNSTIIDNSGELGGIFCFESDATINNCHISNNSADLAFGGGIYSVWGEPKIENCNITDNIAAANGGGVCLSLSDAVLINCTITNNSATIGNDIYFNVSNSIVSNCIIPRIGISVNAGSNIFNYCNIEGSGGSGSSWDASLGTDGGGNIDASPLFVDSDNGDYHLDAGSPCIDAGDNTAVSSTVDIDGDSRKIDDTATTDTGNGTAPIVDMGADEYDPN